MNVGYFKMIFHNGCVVNLFLLGLISKRSRGRILKRVLNGMTDVR